MKKKIAGGIVAVLVLLAISAAGYHASYPIEPNMDTLPEHILAYYNRGRSAAAAPALTVYDGVSIGDRMYYLIEIGEDRDLGNVTLERGLTGRYKIKGLGWGGGNFRSGIVESDGKKYLLFGGRDVSCQISTATFLVSGAIYELHNEAAADHFFLSTEVDDHGEDTYIDFDHVHFYDERGEDITERYDLSGGGIG